MHMDNLLTVKNVILVYIGMIGDRSTVLTSILSFLNSQKPVPSPRRRALGLTDRNHSQPRDAPPVRKLAGAVRLTGQEGRQAALPS